MAFDRSKFKATSTSVIDEEAKRQEEVSKNYSVSTLDGYVPFFKIEDGQNQFRIMPSVSEGVSPYVPFRTIQLKCEVDKKDDSGKKIGTEVKNKKIFIATVHSKKMKKDPCEIYLDYIFAKAEGMDKEEKQKFLNPVVGYRANGKWVPGIRPQSSYVGYCTNTKGELGRIDLKPNWLKEMQKLSIAKSEEEVSTIDVFSDPDEGFPLLITKSVDNAGKLPKTVYSISTKDPVKGQNWDEFFEKNRVSNETLAKLESLTTLEELYVDSYSRRDWDLALDGLQRFDKENNYNIFADEKFLDELEELEKFVPEEKQSSKEEKSQKKETKKSEDSTENNSSSQSKLPSVSKMKRFLKVYVEEEYEGRELPELSEKELQEWYLLAIDEKPLPMPEQDEESGEDEPEGDEEDEGVEDALAKIRNLKNK